MPDVNIWSITQFGAQRVQQDEGSRIARMVGPVEASVLRALLELGGTAEIDELAMSSNIGSPMVIAALKKLEGFGFVTPNEPQPVAVQ